MYLSHVYLYLSSRHHFLFMFSDSYLSIIMYLLNFRFIVVPLISFMLLVIAYTCIPEPHHLIMHMCDCLSTPTSFIISTRRVAVWQPSILMSRSWIVVALLYQIRVAQRKRGLAADYPDPLSSSLPLIGLQDSHLSTREYFPIFHIVHPTFVLLSDCWHLKKDKILIGPNNV